MKMVQKNHKTIVVNEQTYETLKTMGTLTESFNDVISRLIQKAASGQSSFEGRIGQSAVVDRDDPKAEAEAITAK